MVYVASFGAGLGAQFFFLNMSCAKFAEGALNGVWECDGWYQQLALHPRW